MHFKDNHPDQHPFECDLCGHRAIDGSRLKRHLMCHEPDRPREYCNICFKEFRNKVSLRTHKNMVHKVNTFIRISPWFYASLYISLGSSTPARIVARSSIRLSMWRSMKQPTQARSLKGLTVNIVESWLSTQRWKRIIWKYCSLYLYSSFIWFSVEKSRVDSHGRETVQVFGLSIPVYSEKQSQNSHEGSAQEGVAEVRNTLIPRYTEFGD